MEQNFALPEPLWVAAQFALCHSGDEKAGESKWGMVWSTLLGHFRDQALETGSERLQVIPRFSFLLEDATSQLLPVTSISKFDPSAAQIEPKTGPTSDSDLYKEAGSGYEPGSGVAQSSRCFGSPTQGLDAIPLSRGLGGRCSIAVALLQFYSTQEPAQEIYNYEFIPHRAHIPLLLELKSMPSSEKSLPMCPKLTSNPHLAEKMHVAYKKICSKLPHAFASHPSQESVIVLACSGLWWSFAVAKRGDQTIIWSDCFTAGHPPHDEVLLDLVRGAAASPNHPGGEIRVKTQVETHILPPGDEGAH